MSKSRCFAAIAVGLVFAACGGDPGAPIPTRSTGARPVVDASPTAPPDASAGPSAETPHAVGLAVVVEGTGSVRSEPAGIDCPGTCAATFAPGARVTLVPVPAEGWKLRGWGGACADGDDACAVILDRNTSVTASLALLDARWDPSVGKKDCADAWGKAGEKLSPCDTTKDDYVVVRKSKRNTALCKKGALVKNLRSGLGATPVGDKQKQGDGKTPEGVFFVPRLVPDSSYYKAFLLSYPTLDDATRGVAAQLITSADRSLIESAHAACTEPPQNTPLGGDLEIQGNGSSRDWTVGSIALDNADVDLLWTTIHAGDTVVVLP